MGEQSGFDADEMPPGVEPVTADAATLEAPVATDAIASNGPVVEPPPVQVSPPESALLELDRMTFTGTGSEYFRIWIVNLALTIATLGLYSAWAKVRRLQFFYRHTRLAGAGFDYHGDPIAILKGRLVALVLFVLYSAMGYAGTILTLVILIVLAVLLPWLLGRSLRFRLHNSSYRGLRFKFHGTTRQAYWMFLAMPIFTVLSLFWLGPLWHHRLKRYQFSNAAFGGTRFSTAAQAGEFYVAHIMAAVLMGVLLMSLIIVMAMTAVASGIGREPGAAPGAGMPAWFLPAIFGAYILAFVGGQAITTARIQNAVWNTARVGSLGFMCDLSIRRLFWIQISNLVATVFTLGFFRPYALVRLATYMAGCMTLVRAVPFSAFGAAAADDVTALGEETAELFDFDIGF
jgi:uncharacterized membrane protein YjgN (DUF898 family)